MAQDERRRHPRVKVGMRVSCDLGEERCPGSILDLAEGGAFLLVETPKTGLPPNVMLRFWDQGVMCEAWGKTVRTVRTKAGPAVGVKFEGQNPAYLELIRQLTEMDEAARTRKLGSLDRGLVLFHAR